MIKKININKTILVLMSILMCFVFAKPAFAEDSPQSEFTYKEAKINFITKSFDGNNNLEIKLPIEFKDAKLEYIDKNLQVKTYDPKNTDIKDACLFLISDENNYYVISKGASYRDIKENIVQVVSCDTNIIFDKQSLTLKLTLTKTADAKKDLKYSTYYVNTEEKPFKDANDFIMIEKKFNNDKHCILEDGYYYQMSPKARPYEAGYFFSQGAIYVASTLMDAKDSKFSQIMCAKLIDAGEKKLNAEGYYPIPYEIEWLINDYNISKEYFDTRWNLDYAYICLRMYDNYKDEKYIQVADKVLDYYRKYISENNTKIEDGIGSFAYLVMDYGSKDYKAKTLTSLNHHLMGLKTLMYEDLLKGDSANLDYINKMQRAIDLTCDGWIKKDGNLHYARLLNGTYGLADYPDLTLNDLKDCQALYEKLFKNKNASLEKLINSKQKWYDNIYLKNKNKSK